MAGWNFGTHSGREWAKSSVLRILRCETYTGVWHYNKFESHAPAAGGRRAYRRLAKYKLRQRPREEWIRVRLADHLRIIDHAQWERVQSQLARNLSFSERNSRHAYLLRELVVCGGCQARYVGDPNHASFTTAVTGAVSGFRQLERKSSIKLSGKPLKR